MEETDPIAFIKKEGAVHWEHVWEIKRYPSAKTCAMIRGDGDGSKILLAAVSALSSSECRGFGGHDVDRLGHLAGRFRRSGCRLDTNAGCARQGRQLAAHGHGDFATFSDTGHVYGQGWGYALIDCKSAWHHVG